MSQEGTPQNENPDAFAPVFQAELQELRNRRKQTLPEELWLEEGGGAPQAPSTKRGLVGLALSGGGIRSASVCLGVVQELSRQGILKCVDYLSTVSGGGYLGSAVSSLLTHADANALGPERFPLRKEAGQTEPPALRHLRNGSNYLAPPGLLNQLGLPSVFLRGFLLNVAALLPLVCVAVIFTSLYYEGLLPLLLDHGIEFDLLSMRAPFATAVAAFVVLALLFPFALVFFRRGMVLDARSRYQRVMAGALFTVLALLVLRPMLVLVNLAAYLTPQQAGSLLQKYVLSLADNPLPWIAFLAGLGALAVFPRGRSVLKALGMAVGAISGPLVLFATYLGLCLWQINPLREIPCDAQDLEHFRNGDIQRVESALYDSEPELLRMLGSTSPKASSAPAPRTHGLIHRGSFDHAVDARVGSATLDLRWKESEGVAVVSGSVFDLKGLEFFLLVGLVLLLNNRFLNINFTSAHTFYRDQLSRVFIVREEGEDVASNDALKLSSLMGGPGGVSSAPYHLINATVNLDSDASNNLRGRHGATFFFSKHFVGSEQTGWCPTPKMEAADPYLDLGQAMSISAAAVSTNMGVFSSKAYSFWLMLLNVRLGYWIPNPGLVAGATSAWSRRPFWGPGPRYLLKEAVGPLEATSRYVNVTDGGHIENLGVYELLRRRCKRIISVDAEADPDMHFHSLVQLLRFAEIDMGIQITLDLEPLRKTDGLSQAHYALGLIDYGGGETGELIYIKASVTGDENPYVLAYRETQPSFPHESTANQFFTETQLEVYRALGEHMTHTAQAALQQRIPVAPEKVAPVVALPAREVA